MGIGVGQESGSEWISVILNPKSGVLLPARKEIVDEFTNVQHGRRRKERLLRQGKTGQRKMATVEQQQCWTDPCSSWTNAVAVSITTRHCTEHCFGVRAVLLYTYVSFEFYLPFFGALTDDILIAMHRAYRRASWLGGGSKYVIILAANQGGGVMEWKGPREWAIERDSVRNKKRYAKKWGYDLEIVDMSTKKRYAHEWRESWEKVDTIRNCMKKYPKADWCVRLESHQTRIC